MNLLIRKYKPVIQFVALFLGTYFFFGILYSVYLQLSKNGAYYPDFLTYLTARQSWALILPFEPTAALMPDFSEPMIRLYIGKVYLAKIIEGCNSLSVIILFASFVIAFRENLKKTVIFILAGAVLIYSANLFRIVLLAISLYHFPRYEYLLHTVVFPGIIYGMTFILWIVWVKKLEPIKNRNEKVA